MERERRSAKWVLPVLVGALVLSGCASLSSAPAEPRVSGTTGVTGPAPDTAPPSTAVPASTTQPPKVYAAGSFDATNALLDERVRSAGLSGGYLRIVADDGSTIHEHGVGGIRGSTPLDIASSTKWYTAATLMTFVDRGAVGLDDDVARWLPEFAGSNPPITVREVLDHTSGVRDNPCQNGGSGLAACVRTLASSAREFPAGTRFSYGNAPFLVAGRIVEVVGGADFATVVERQLTGPLGMDDTTWPGAPTSANPAFGARTTADDYGRFLAMILHDGAVGETRVLSAAAVHELVRNQVGAYDTSHDYSVGLTRIPRYGLGSWPDVVDGSGRTVVVSGNGGKGLYPWVDFATRTWGIVAVQDDRGAEFAVPASQKVAVEARSAVAR